MQHIEIRGVTLEKLQIQKKQKFKICQFKQTMKSITIKHETNNYLEEWLPICQCTEWILI